MAMVQTPAAAAAAAASAALASDAAPAVPTTAHLSPLAKGGTIATSNDGVSGIALDVDDGYTGDYSVALQDGYERPIAEYAFPANDAALPYYSTCADDMENTALYGDADAAAAGTGAAPVPAGGVCGRGAASGGRACKNTAVAGSQFCAGHTCEAAGCFQTKSSAAAGCSMHALAGSTAV